MTIEGLRLKIRKFFIKRFAKRRNKKLVNKEFTIISNNCWGGMVYESYDLVKSSPTVGLFFMAEEYLAFLRKFPDILNAEIEFIEPEKSRYAEHLKKDKRFGSYPIAVIDGVEIECLHYKSKEEFEEKWKRRCKRVNLEKLIVKFNDQNLCKKEHLEAFSKMGFKNKLIFSSTDYPDVDGLIFIKKAEKQDRVLASQEPILSKKHIDLTKIINEL